jgi:hypothetical protein
MRILSFSGPEDFSVEQVSSNIYLLLLLLAQKYAMIPRNHFHPLTIVLGFKTPKPIHTHIINPTPTRPSPCLSPFPTGPRHPPFGQREDPVPALIQATCVTYPPPYPPARRLTILVHHRCPQLLKAVSAPTTTDAENTGAPMIQRQS